MAWHGLNRRLVWRLGAAFGVGALLMVGGAPARAEAQFLSGFGDVPLMAGLKEEPQTWVVFDKPGGRIVQVVARGAVDGAAVEKFYTATLAQLGWRGHDGAFEREGEVLRITIEAQNGGIRVQFMLSPREESSPDGSKE